MKFLCLAYYDEKKFDAMPKGELDAIVAQCKAHDDALRDGGRLSMIASLAAPATSKSVRPRNGRPSITDGPYAEAKECLGSFFIIEAADLDQATAEASKHPAAHLGEAIGWGIEVRPIEFFRQS
jgi:hypothetical protein